MDANRFDALSRVIGAQADRRAMVKAAAGGTLAALGLGAFAGDVLGQDVGIEARGFKGKPCDNNRECRKGLKCNQNRGKCEYKNNCGGKKNDACRRNKECCRGFECRRRKCKRKKRN